MALATTEAAASSDRSLTQRVNPLTMVVIGLAAAIVGLFYGPIYWACFFVASLILAGLAGNLGTFLKVFAAAILPAAALMFALQFFFTPGGRVLVHWWIFDGTTNGLAAAIKFVTRFLVIGTGVLLLVSTVDLQRFSRDLEQRGVSPRATYVMQSTFMIIPEMQKRASAILDAQRARGIETDSNIIVRLNALLPAVAPLILSSLTGVEERAMSLEARGMTLRGAKTSLLHVPDTTADKVVRWLAVLAAVAAIGWKVWLWTR